MTDRILFWHRKDLRLSDNAGLSAARQRTAQLTGVFCLDPDILAADDIAPARVAFMIGCLEELQARYAQAGSQLLILQGKPEQKFPPSPLRSEPPPSTGTKTSNPIPTSAMLPWPALYSTKASRPKWAGTSSYMPLATFAPARATPTRSMAPFGKTGASRKRPPP